MKVYGGSGCIDSHFTLGGSGANNVDIFQEKLRTIREVPL
jgi:hypothetical protein